MRHRQTVLAVLVAAVVPGGAVAVSLAAGGAGSTVPVPVVAPTQPERPVLPGPSAAGVRVFASVYLDEQLRFVEVAGEVPIVADDADAPVVYLELFACGRHTKEHEALVVTDALSSHLHAALLLLGLESGKPVEWTFDEATGTVKGAKARGPELRVEARYIDRQGVERMVPISTWVRHLQTGETLEDRPLLFAGSRLVERPDGRALYEADADGTMVGLAAFGTETVAWPELIHHDSGVQEPVWVAHNERVPRFGTPVRLRFTPVPAKPAADDAADPGDGPGAAPAGEPVEELR